MCGTCGSLVGLLDVIMLCTRTECFRLDVDVSHDPPTQRQEAVEPAHTIDSTWPVREHVSVLSSLISDVRGDTSNERSSRRVRASMHARV